MLVYQIFSTSGNSLPNSANKSFFSLLKLVVPLDLEAIISKMCIQVTQQTMYFLKRHCLKSDWKKTWLSCIVMIYLQLQLSQKQVKGKLRLCLNKQVLVFNLPILNYSPYVCQPTGLENFSEILIAMIWASWHCFFTSSEPESSSPLSVQLLLFLSICVVFALHILCAPTNADDSSMGNRESFM